MFEDPAIKRAARSIKAANNFRPREKLWITLPMLEKIVEWARSHAGYNRYVVLFALAYIFLLRLPSEALPMVLGPSSDNDKQSVLHVLPEELILYLKRRKNQPFGGKLVRRCWCRTSRSTCPVHVFGRSMRNMSPGTEFFPNISAGNALSVLRHILMQINVSSAQLYRTHDLRRGHVKDMQKSGVSDQMYENISLARMI